MKNVCFIVNDFNFFYTHRFDLAKKLIKKHEFSVSVICSTSNANSNEIFDCSENLINIIHLPQRTESKGLLNYLRCLNKLISKLNFDQLIFVTLELSFIAAIIGCFKKTPRMIFIISGLGHQFFLNNIKQLFLRKLEKFVFKGSIKKNSHNCFIFQNKDDQRVFKDLGILEGYANYVIAGNGIDIHKYYYVKRELEKIVFCYAGRASKAKGTHLLLEAFKLLKAEQHTKEILLKLFILPSYKREEIYLKESEDILITYDLNQKDLIKALHESNIFVMPSEREGLPKAALEAASTGMPVIASNRVGSKDILIEGLTGWIYEHPAIESLFNCMQSAIKDYKNLNEMGINSRNLVIEKFSLNRIAEQYSQLLLYK